MAAKSWMHALLLLFASLAFTSASAAQGYPSRPIKLIVPFAAGGASDIVARIIQPEMSRALDETIIIENRGGAAGTIGTAIAARAAPDGYTLVLVPASHAINPSLYRHLPFDTLKAFAPIALVDTGPLLLAVHPSLPVKSVGQLINLARKRPGQLLFCSGGIGSGSHLAGALFDAMAKVSMTHVPYKGLGPALIDLVSGQTQVVFSPMLPVVPLVKSGKLRAIAVTSAKRSPIMPDLPTVAETVPGYEFIAWHGILAPAGTPPDIISKLHDAVTRALESPAVKRQLLGQGLVPGSGTAAQFETRIRNDMVRFAKLITNLHIRAR